MMIKKRAAWLYEVAPILFIKIFYTCKQNFKKVNVTDICLPHYTNTLGGVLSFQIICNHFICKYIF